MKSINIVINKKDDAHMLFYTDIVTKRHDDIIPKATAVFGYFADSTKFMDARAANKIINDYAVTQLPFVLLVDDSLPQDKREYAAVYSEEGPITVDRINEKL